MRPILYLTIILCLTACKATKVYEKAQKSNDIALLESYISKYPKHKHIDAAEKQIVRLQDEQDWAIAKRADNSAAYSQYLSDHPTGAFESKAKSNLALTREREQWKSSLRENTVGAYELYLAKWPSGSNSADARIRIAKLKEELAWSEASRLNTIGSYSQFLSLFPTSIHSYECKDKVERLKDEQAWADASRSESVEGYQAYLNQFPNGRNRYQAKVAIEDLNVIVPAWNAALGINSFQAFKAFKERHPFSKYDKLASSKMDAFAEQALASIMTNPSPSKLRQFKLDFSGTLPIYAAENTLQDLDKAAWEKAAYVNTSAEYKRYLSQFPEGLFSDEAKDALMELADPWYNWDRVKITTGDVPDCSNYTPKFAYGIDNYLEIQLGYSRDAVIKLMDKYSEVCIRMAYIRGGETFRMMNIPEGKYYLKIAYGNDFAKYRKAGTCRVEFKKNAIYEKGSDVLDYYIKKTYQEEQIPSFELYLEVQETSGKALNLKDVSAEEFNR